MSKSDQIGQFPPLLAGEEKTLTFQVDDELPVGVTLTGAPTVEVTTVRGTDPNPSAFVLSSGFDAGTRNILVLVKGLLRAVEYEIRVLSDTSDPTHKVGRAGRIEVQ